MTCPANHPNLPLDPHSHELAHYAHALLALSGVPTASDDPAHEVWRRLDDALTRLEARLTRHRDRPPSKVLTIKYWPVQHIKALAEHFRCPRAAIGRQLLWQCPVESFPDGWVAEDRRLTEERRIEAGEAMHHAAQLAHLEEVL